MRIVLKGNGRRIVLRQVGVRGQTGPQGPQGLPGQDGEGLPTGGTAGQVPVKQSSTDFDIAWETPPAAPVASVNGQTGVVVLDAGDVGADALGSAAQALSDANDYTDSAVAAVDTGVMTVVAGDNVTVDNTDPANPIVSAADAPAAPVTSVNGRTGDVTGLAEQSSLTAHTSNTSNPHSVTKAQVGLGNVDNTSDLDKPISTATQSALDLKANASSVVNLTGNQTINGEKSFTNLASFGPASGFGTVFQVTRDGTAVGRIDNNQVSGGGMRVQALTGQLQLRGPSNSGILVGNTAIDFNLPVTLSGNSISSSFVPSSNEHLTNKLYVDSTVNSRLSQSQRNAIDALNPGTATAADIVNALQAT